MAHVLCELMVRLRAVGLVEDHACDLPITQGEFADALGFTTAHVNRVLQQMRADGLIDLSDVFTPTASRRCKPYSSSGVRPNQDW